jgi:hypothetical protein
LAVIAAGYLLLIFIVIRTPISKRNNVDDDEDDIDIDRVVSIDLKLNNEYRMCKSIR